MDFWGGKLEFLKCDFVDLFLRKKGDGIHSHARGGRSELADVFEDQMSKVRHES